MKNVPDAVPVRRLRRAAIAVAALATLAVPARADDGSDAPPAGAAMSITGTLDVSPVGDATAEVLLTFPEGVYAKVKESAPDPKKFLQDVRPERADYQIGPDPKATYDDKKRAVVLRLTELGAAKNRGDGLWEQEVEEGLTLLSASTEGPRPSFRFESAGEVEGGDATWSGEVLLRLPAGSKEANYDAAARKVSWRLRWGGGTGEGRLATEFKAKDRLMTSIYKVYGLGADFAAQWVAKTVWKNVGTNAVRNLKVRYRLAGYGDWSPWSKFPEVVPGQTVVSLYYPVLDASVARIRSNTPADVLLEWKWEDSQGKVREDDDAKRVVLLGVNEYVFSNLVAGESFGTWAEAFNNAPLLAAWVSRNDAVVKQFAAMANRLAGGVGGTTDDASALRVLKACYDLLRINDFTYQHPPALDDKQVSFDVQRVQNVKFPRDVVRDRSGTCIDLAILYAAMANAVGLEPYLALVPGHCFPFVKLPSGTHFAVETTGVAGGVRFGSAPFARVAEIGNQELEDAKKDGRLYVVDVRENWTRGVSNPELDEFPADVLQKWGVTETPKGDLGPDAALPPGPSPAGHPDPVLGAWGGAMGGAKVADNIRVDAMALGIEKDAQGVYTAGVRMEFTVATADGDARVVVAGIYADGKATAEGVQFAATRLTRTVAPDGKPEPIDWNGFVVRAVPGGVQGAFAGDGGFSFTLAPRKEEPAPAPAPAAGLDGLLGVFGGSMNRAKVGEGIFLDAMTVGVEKGDGGTFHAGVRLEFTLGTENGNARVVATGIYENGRADGARVRFPATKLERTTVETGDKGILDGNPMWLEVAEGGIKGEFTGEGGFTFTLASRDDAPEK